MVTTETKHAVDICNSYLQHDNDFKDHPSVKLVASKMLLDLTFQPVSCSYVREILANLNPLEAVSVDGISPRLLRLASPILAEDVTQLINYLIFNQSWPTEWKSGNT